MGTGQREFACDQAWPGAADAAQPGAPAMAGGGDGLVTIIVPARDETGIAPVISRIARCVRADREILVVVDSAEDLTVPSVRALAATVPGLRCLVSPYPPGPAGAIRHGFDVAGGDVTVVTMADGSDDPAQIDVLVGLVRRGAVIAAASRYSAGGRQVGGPAVRRLLSRLAGISLRTLAGAGTCDATNSFKAYLTGFVREVGIDSRAGFAVGIELTAKARRLRLPVAEIPTTWRERRQGRSRFRLAAWLPGYARWYLFCFGRRLSAGELRARCAAGGGPW